MARKLASIQIISEVLPHPNADRLEIAKILGWNAIVLKGEYKAGETVVYVETDSILPEGKDEWAFMKERHFHVKTIKLRGTISQGLVFHTSILPSMDDTMSENGVSGTFYDIGDDVTEILGITKYEPYVPAQLAGQVKGKFPEFLFKTDEQRIQSVPELLEKHHGKKFIATEKLDGTSVSYILKDGEFKVCSRNLELAEDETNLYWKVARAEGVEKEMRYLANDPVFGVKNFAVQGELVGQGIQGNKYKLNHTGLYIFNVFNIDTGKYIDLRPFKNEECNFLGFDLIEHSGFFASVPIISIDYILPKTVEELVEFSKGNSFLNPKVLREGVVLRPLIEEYSDELHGRLSFKIINPEFLLKHEE